MKDLATMLEEALSTPKQEFIYRGINKGGMGFIYGPPKSGKTTLCECITLSLIGDKSELLNDPLLRYSHPPKVLFISLEEWWTSRAERYKSQTKELNVENMASFMSNQDELPLYVTNEKQWEELEDYIKQSQAEILVIDSMSRICPMFIEQSSEAAKVMKKLREMTLNLSLTTLIIHHTTKVYEDHMLSLGNMAGSRVLAQDADFILGVGKLSDGTRYLKDVANRYKEDKETITLFKINENRVVQFIGEQYEHQVIGSTMRRLDNRVDNSSRDEITRILSGVEENTMETNKLVELMINHSGKSQSQIEKLLKAMVEEKVLSKPKKGVYKLITRASAVFTTKGR